MIEHADHVSPLIRDVARLVASLEQEVADLLVLAPDRDEPVLLETALVQARHALDDALTILRTHRPVA